MDSHQCEKCGKVLKSKKALRAHAREHNANYTCPVCGRIFHKKFNLRRHQKTHTEQKSETDGSSIGASTSTADIQLPHVQNAFGGALQVKDFKVGGEMDILHLYSAKRDNLLTYLKDQINIHGAFKYFIHLTVEFIKINKDEEENSTRAFFNSFIKTLFKGNTTEEIQIQLDQSIFKLYSLVEEFQRMGSGWVVSRIIKLQVHRAKYQPNLGSGFLPLPKGLRQRGHSILNIHSSDQFCFLYCILAYLKPVGKNPSRASHYMPYRDTLICGDMKFPPSFKDIAKFEKWNDISCNIFGYDEGFYPLRIAEVQRKRTANLLLIENEEKKHFCLIRDVNKAFNTYSKHHGRKYFCVYCLTPFGRQDLLDAHVSLCKPHGPQRVEYPSTDNNILKFKNYYKQQRMPFTIYCDIESILVKQPLPQKNPQKIHHHQPSGFGYLLVSSMEGVPNSFKMFTGKNCIRDGVADLIRLGDELYKKLTDVKPMQLTKDDYALFFNAKDCGICKLPLGDDRCFDHSHYDGKVRQICHVQCNILYRKPKFIPTYCHGLANYDSHFIVNTFGNYPNRRLSVIAKDMEKYTCFSLGPLKFLDSFAFLPTSLGQLVSNLAQEGTQHFHFVKKYFPDPAHHKLLLQKGIYFYEYADNYEIFEEKALPPRDRFYSSLTLDTVTEMEYEHAQNVFTTFNMQNLWDYHNTYLKSDILQLADCFEHFRNQTRQNLELDPCFYISTPGLTFDAALLMTKVELELITEPEHYLLWEKAVRGGVACISRRYARANHSDMLECDLNTGKFYMGWDESKESCHLLDLDANALYSHCMSQCLPTGGFYMYNSEEIAGLDLQNFPDEGPIALLLEVDLFIDPSLHDYLNCLPPCPEHLTVTYDMLSPYSKELLKLLNINYKAESKLVPNLLPKDRYVVTHKVMKLYQALGVQIKKIHRVLQYRQSPWLKKYVDFQTELRKNAKNKFEKDLAKLYCNSLYGKMLENKRSHANIELVHNEKRFLKLVAKANLKSFVRFNEGLAAVHLRFTRLTLDSPIFVGAQILDLAKYHMYFFFYRVLKEGIFKGRVFLLGMDTDSVIVALYTNSLYRDLKELEPYLDFSGYPTSHPLYNSGHRNTPGYFKDELNSKIMLEWVGLKAKLYSMQVGILFDVQTVSRAKGVSKAVRKKLLKHGHYRAALFEEKQRFDHNMRIGSDKHEVYTFDTYKSSLNSFDTKRYICQDKIHTLAFGHYKIAELENKCLQNASL